MEVPKKRKAGGRPFPKGHKPVNGFDKRPQDINRDPRKISAALQVKKIMEEVLLGEDEFTDSANRKVLMERVKAVVLAMVARAVRDSSADANALLNHVIGSKLRFTDESEQDRTELSEEDEKEIAAYMKRRIFDKPQ